MSAITARRYRYGDLVIFPGMIQEEYKLREYVPGGSLYVQSVPTGRRTITAEFRAMGSASDLTALHHQLSAMTQDTPGCSLRTSFNHSEGWAVTAEFQLKLHYHENDQRASGFVKALTMPAPEEAK